MCKSFFIFFLGFFLINTDLFSQNGQSKNVLCKTNGAKIYTYSSSYGAEWDVNNLIAGKPLNIDSTVPMWCSDAAAPFPHFAIIKLPKIQWITTFVFNNKLADETAWPGISAKNLELSVSQSSPTSGFQKIASFDLERNTNNQEIKVAPLKARYIKITINSNWGYKAYTQLGQLGAYDDGSRPLDIVNQLKTKGYVDAYGIYFDFASANLRPESTDLLTVIHNWMLQSKNLKICVEGHTDNRGDSSLNQKLSQQRAQSVVEALITMGNDANQLTYKGLGMTQPLQDNNTSLGRAKNRRVTFRIVK